MGKSGSAKYSQYGEQYGPPPMTNITACRHKKGACIAFLDTHCEWLPEKSVANNDKLWKTKQKY